MPEKIRVQTAMHTAILDPLEGVGLLVTPLPEDDVRLSPLDSLLESDWSAMVGKLVSDGWSFATEDECDNPAPDVILADGRRCYLLLSYLHEDEPATIEDRQRFALATHRLLEEIED